MSIRVRRCLLAAAIGWLYAGTVSGLAAEWASSPDASYGIVLALVALAVAWRRREAFSATRSIPRAPALPGRRGAARRPRACTWPVSSAPTYSSPASRFVIVVTGALWFLAGPRAVRVIAAPLVFLLIAVPLPALVVNAITLPLQLTASRVAEASLATMGVPVFRDGNVLELPSTTLRGGRGVQRAAIDRVARGDRRTARVDRAVAAATPGHRRLEPAGGDSDERPSHRGDRPGVRSVGAAGRVRLVAHVQRMGDVPRVRVRARPAAARHGAGARGDERPGRRDR